MTEGSYTPLTYRIAFAGLQGMGVDLARKLLDVVGSEEHCHERERPAQPHPWTQQDL